MLFKGCGDHQEEAVAELFEDDYGFSLEEFFRAAGTGDVAAVRSFIAAGINPNVTDVAKVQALHVACASGRSRVVELLLEEGADPGTPRGDERTPLMLASRIG